MPRPLRTLRRRLQALALVGALAVAGTGVTGLAGFRTVAATEAVADVHEEALLAVARLDTRAEHLRALLALREAEPDDGAVRGDVAAAGAAWSALLDDEQDDLHGPVATAYARWRADALALTARVARARAGEAVWPSPEQVEPVQEALEAVAEQIDETA